MQLTAGLVEEAEAVLAEAVGRFHPRLYVACSFQKEASVIMDLLLRIEPAARFFTLDTGLFFPETYATWVAFEQCHGVSIDVYSGPSLEHQAARHGEALWERDPDTCCAQRKVAPLAEALSGVDAWVSGLRRDQSPTRRDTEPLHWDARHGLWKVNPLVSWTERDVWRYICDHALPYHPLHDRGYASIGCAPCTRPGGGREGRWVASGKTECGLHA
jgi:phosphoadenosine phosphosulfate reductase